MADQFLEPVTTESASAPAGDLDRLMLPPVLLIDELAALLRISRRQIEHLRQFNRFPFPEINPPWDSRPRWLTEDVVRLLRAGVSCHGRQGRRRAA